MSGKSINDIIATYTYLLYSHIYADWMTRVKKCRLKNRKIFEHGDTDIYKSVYTIYIRGSQNVTRVVDWWYIDTARVFLLMYY